MSIVSELQKDRDERFRYEAGKFVEQNAKKINRKLDYQEQVAEHADILYEISLLKGRVMVEHRKLQGLDTRHISLRDMDTGREMAVDIVYLYNNYILTDNSFIYLLVRKNDGVWAARAIENLIWETIDQVNAVNVYFAMDKPHRWNKAPIYNKIKQALEQLTSYR